MSILLKHFVGNAGNRKSSSICCTTVPASRLSAISILILALLAPLPASALIIDFQAASNNVLVGESFAVDIVVTDLAASSEIVQAFDLFIGYDDSILQLDSIALGPGPDASFSADTLLALGSTFDLGLSFLGTSGFGGGDINISASSLMPGLLPLVQGDSALLGVLNYTAIAGGAASLGFLDHPFFATPTDIKGLDPALPLVFDDVGALEISVAVPEPGALGLMSLGLLGMAWVNRRRLLRPG